MVNRNKHIQEKDTHRPILELSLQPSTTPDNRSGKKSVRQERIHLLHRRTQTGRRKTHLRSSETEQLPEMGN